MKLLKGESMRVVLKVLTCFDNLLTGVNVRFMWDFYCRSPRLSSIGRFDCGS